MRSRLCREDALELLSANPLSAYYDAQRIAARARFRGDRHVFMHWTRAAAEIAAISDCPMDRKIVQAIFEEEARGATPALQNDRTEI